MSCPDQAFFDEGEEEYFDGHINDVKKKKNNNRKIDLAYWKTASHFHQ